MPSVRAHRMSHPIKAELQAEQPPAVPRHHSLGLCDGLAGCQFRMLRQNVAGHGIAVRSHDAGDDQQHRPKKNIHGLKQHGHSYGFPIGKVGKQGLKGRLFSGGQVQIEPGIAHFDNTAQNENTGPPARLPLRSGRSRRQPELPAVPV